MITTRFLELTSISNLRPPRTSATGGIALRLKKVDCPIACMSMYETVGKGQYWEIYRIGWSALHWQQYVRSPDVEVLYLCGGDDTQIGYMELRCHQDSSVEIVNFGLLPQFIGQGIGGHALTLAVKRAFELGSAGVWLHTCSLDHPSALHNYYARGFRLIREEVTDYLPLDPVPIDATSMPEKKPASHPSGYHVALERLYRRGESAAAH